MVVAMAVEAPSRQRNTHVPCRSYVSFFVLRVPAEGVCNALCASPLNLLILGNKYALYIGHCTAVQMGAQPGVMLVLREG